MNEKRRPFLKTGRMLHSTSVLFLKRATLYKRNTNCLHTPYLVAVLVRKLESIRIIQSP